MHFRTNAAPTGSGKIYAATTFACERIPTGMKTAILQPTIKLCQQSSFDAKKRYPGCRAQIRRIVSDSGVEQKVSGRITDYLNTRDASGALLYITHAGFLRTQHWHRAKDWHLFLDEALDIAYYRRLRLKDHRHLLHGLFTVYPANNSAPNGILEAIDHWKLQAALAALPDGEVHEHFADMTSRLADGTGTSMSIWRSGSSSSPVRCLTWTYMVCSRLKCLSDSPAPP